MVEVYSDLQQSLSAGTPAADIRKGDLSAASSLLSKSFLAGLSLRSHLADLELYQPPVAPFSAAAMRSPCM